MQEIDHSLLKACIKKDIRAEYALYKLCFQPLMSICYRYTNNEDDAADLVNKCFYKILKNLESYDPAKPFEKWIKSIMINTIIDEYRAHKKQKELIAQVNIEELKTNIHPVDLNEAEVNLTAEDIHRFISTLPETSKMVLNLYVFEGMSHKEIAETLKMSEGTSKWHLSTARSTLKTMLAKAMASLKIYLL